MKDTTFPGFNAEASIYKTSNYYRMGEHSRQSEGNVQAQLLSSLPGIPNFSFSPFEFGFDFSCPGTTTQCISRCPPSGKERSLCVTLCQQTPVCGPCNCKCNSDCTRTCTQSCSRTIIGPPFRNSSCTRACNKFPDQVFEIPDQVFEL